MKRIMLAVSWAAMVGGAPAVVAEDDDFPAHRDRFVRDMEDKLNCIRKEKKWEDSESCDEAAERREKERRLEELAAQQRRIEEELKEYR